MARALTPPMTDEADPSQVRTDLAEDRTLLANERTFAGWLRTGFAAVGIGLGFHVLFEQMQPAWLPRAIATTFMLVGIGVAVAAERRSCTVRRRLSAHIVKSAKPMNLRIITIAMAVATLALIATIWLVPIGRDG